MRDDDLPLALGLWGDYEVTKLIDGRGQLTTTNHVRQRLIKEIATAKEHGMQYWPIFLRETDEHVGCCGLRPYDLTKDIYEIGFHIEIKGVSFDDRQLYSSPGNSRSRGRTRG